MTAPSGRKLQHARTGYSWAKNCEDPTSVTFSAFKLKQAAFKTNTDQFIYSWEDDTTLRVGFCELRSLPMPDPGFVFEDHLERGADEKRAGREELIKKLLPESVIVSAPLADDARTACRKRGREGEKESA
ncbi:hypothetical protein BaRGS_00009628 [Batillaria attramentaria]|uniref:Uncharacterized protein n=1 Tax=Batillaria attramentaria TaxID=370345 RepID=A0ABD0LIQ9_9CAEN